MLAATTISNDVCTVESDDVATLSEVLASAFCTDPVGEWLFPEPGVRREGLRRLFELELRQVVLPHATSLTNQDRTGAALWLPPGHWKVPPLTLTKLLPRFMGLFGRRLSIVLRGLFEVEKHHPDDENHFYLPFIGVAPGHQGRGLGSALLLPILDTCDRDGVGAYLEATNQDNLRLYERHGFKAIGEVVLPSGPPLWPMWRPPNDRVRMSDGSHGQTR